MFLSFIRTICFNFYFSTSLTIRKIVSIFVEFATVGPQIFPFSFGDEPINSGETISVQCTILKGDSPLNFTWLLNQQPVVNGNNGISILNMKRFSSLNIDSVQALHSGRYTCFANNVAGTVEYSADLLVNGTFFIHVFLFI